jgi:hypothetical protein
MLGSVVDLVLAFRLAGIKGYVLPSTQLKICSLCGWYHSNAMQLLLLYESSEECSS